MGEDKDIATMEDADIRAELEGYGITLHHKTGSTKLASTLAEVRAGTYNPPAENEPTAPPIPPVTGPTDAAKQAAANSKKLTKQQRAMKLQRIVVSPNDPNMSSYPGLIFTVGSSAINRGRMIKKFVPFNNDAGWHVPQIIIDQIENAEMQKFKMVKLHNGQSVMQPYITKKFNVQILPPLTVDEMKSLAAMQAAKGGTQ